MQQTMASMQGHVKTLRPKIMQLEKDAVAQLRTARESEQPTQPPQSAQPSQPSKPPKP